MKKFLIILFTLFLCITTITINAEENTEGGEVFPSEENVSPSDDKLDDEIIVNDNDNQDNHQDDVLDDDKIQNESNNTDNQEDQLDNDENVINEDDNLSDDQILDDENKDDIKELDDESLKEDLELVEENNEENTHHTEKDIKYNNILGAPKASEDPVIYYHVSDDPNSDFYTVKYSRGGHEVVMGDYWGITDVNSAIFAWEDENGEIYYPYHYIGVDSEMHLYPLIHEIDKYEFNDFVYDGVVFDSDLILYGTIEDPYHEENVVKFAEDSPYIPQSIYPFSHLTPRASQSAFQSGPSINIESRRYDLIWSGGIGFSIPIEDVLGAYLKLDYGIIGELNGRQVKAELIISEITPIISPWLKDSEPIAVYFQVADVPTAGIFSTNVESCTYEIILKFVDNNHLLKNAAMTYSSLSFGQDYGRYVLSYEAVAPISSVKKISLRADGTPNIYPSLMHGRSFRWEDTYESGVPSLRNIVRNNNFYRYRGFTGNFGDGGFTLHKSENEDYYYMVKSLGRSPYGIAPVEVFNDYLYITPFSSCIDANLSVFVPGLAEYLDDTYYFYGEEYQLAQIINGGFGRKYTENKKEVRNSETFDRHAATIYYETSDMKFNMLSNYGTMWWTVEPHAWQEIEVIKNVNNNTPYKGETIEYTVTVTAETQDYVVFNDVADSGILVDENSIRVKNVEVPNWNYNIKYADNTISANLPSGVTTITYNAIATTTGTFDNTATATIYNTELTDNDTERIKVKPGNLKYKVVKVWDDDNSKNRPENITLTLYDNYNSDIISTSNAMNTWVKDDNIWTYTFVIPEDVLQYNIVKAGTYDGVDWAVVQYANGIVQLQIGNMDEVQTMTDRTTRYNTDFPWYKYLGDGSGTPKVNSITFVNKVIGNGSYRGMFRAFNGGALDLSNFDCTNVTEMHNMLANVRAGKIIFNSTFAKAPGFNSLKNNSDAGFPIGNWTRIYDGQYRELTNQTAKDFTTIFNSISSTNSEDLAGIWTTNQGGTTPFSVYEEVPQGYTSDAAIDNKLNLTVGPNIITNKLNDNTFRIKKTDNKGNLIGGVELQIYSSQPGNSPITIVTDGTTEWYELPIPEPGEYIIRETSTPAEFTIIDDIHFTVTEDQKIIVNGEETTDIVIVNNPTLSLKVRKDTVDNLEGTFNFTTRIYKPENRELILNERGIINSIKAKLSYDTNYTRLGSSYTRFGSIGDNNYNARYYPNSKKIVISTSRTVSNECADIDIRYQLRNATDYKYITFKSCSVQYPDLSDQLGEMNYNGEYSFTLTNNDSILLEGIPYGYNYNVYETVPQDWFSESEISYGGVLKDELTTLSFVNNKYHKLSIKKEASHNKDEEFKFKIKIWKPLGNNSRVYYTNLIESTNNHSVEKLNDSEYTFILKPNQELIISNIPHGYEYEVYELDKDGNIINTNSRVNNKWTLTSATNNIGTLEDDINVVFRNTLDTYDLTIEKQVTGNMGNKNDRFSFTAMFYTYELDSLEQTYGSSDTVEREDGTTVRASGTARFDYSHGGEGVHQEIVLKDTTPYNFDRDSVVAYKLNTSTMEKTYYYPYNTNASSYYYKIELYENEYFRIHYNYSVQTGQDIDTSVIFPNLCYYMERVYIQNEDFGGMIRGNIGDNREILDNELGVSRNTTTYEYCFVLSDDETKVFENLPAGTFYEIVENDYTNKGYKTKIDGKVGRVIKSSIERNTTHIVENRNQAAVPTEIRIYWLSGCVPILLAAIWFVYKKKKGMRYD